MNTLRNLLVGATASAIALTATAAPATADPMPAGPPTSKASEPVTVSVPAGDLPPGVTASIGVPARGGRASASITDSGDTSHVAVGINYLRLQAKRKNGSWYNLRYNPSLRDGWHAYREVETTPRGIRCGAGNLIRVQVLFKVNIDGMDFSTWMTTRSSRC